MAEKAKQKVIVVVEDEPMEREMIRETLRSYDQVKIEEAEDAGVAMRLLFPAPPDTRPDALILDLMMPYGSAARELDAPSDREEIHTGERVLRRLLEAESETRNRPWIAIITARVNPQLIKRLQGLLQDSGRIYTKPFSILELENDLACVLGIKSLVPPVLLSLEYVPPKGYTMEAPHESGTV